MSSTTGDTDLRSEHIDAMVKGFALQAYKMKQVVMVQTASAWQESYYQEGSTELSGGTGSAIKAVPRLANFPYGEPNWTKKQAWMDKYAFEGVISYEDKLMDNIPVITRTLLRITRAVVKSVDDEIWDIISDSQTAATTVLNKVQISAGNEWDSATVANRDPTQDILNAIKEIEIDNYPIHNGNGFILFSPKDFANVMGNANVRNVGEFYKDILTNGVVGRLLGLKVIVSNSVTDDYCLVGLANECATWKQAVSLKVFQIDDPGIKTTIRVLEIGTTQLTNPLALCLISNTQKT